MYALYVISHNDENQIGFNQEPALMIVIPTLLSVYYYNVIDVFVCPRSFAFLVHHIYLHPKFIKHRCPLLTARILILAANF